MQAIAEASGHSLTHALEEAGGWHYLPGRCDLEGTSFPQGLTACIRNEQTTTITIKLSPLLDLVILSDIMYLLKNVLYTIYLIVFWFICHS